MPAYSGLAYSSSPKRLATSAAIASIASAASAPAVVTVMVIPGPAPKRQNAHDRGPADGFPATAECDSGIEPIDTLHEFRRRARVEPLAIDDFKGADKGIPGRFEIRTIIAGLKWDGMVLDHLPLNTRLAT